jgi:hypothetical protein
MMHPIDRAAALMIRRGPQRLRIFPAGWGERAVVARMEDIDSVTAEPPAINISWARTKYLADRTVRDGTFAAITDVPTAAETAFVRSIEPPRGTGRMCLLMAAWNDHGYDTRQQLAGQLLSRGIGSLLLEIPYYGKRRVVGPDEQPIQTVADFARMGLGAVAEGRALLRHFKSEYTVGVCGYSMGGNIGALVGAAAGFPVAMTPLAASYSPGPVFLDGVISNGIQWQALGGIQQRDALRSALTAASVQRLPRPHWAGAAVMVAAKHDGFIPTTAVDRLHRHWTGSELRWRRGGHATLLWRQRHVLADAVADSFERLATLPST